MAHRLQYRRDTKANWLKYNPVLMEGEVGYETDTHHQKVGDGVSTYSELEYEIGVGNITQETGDSETLVMSQNSITNELIKIIPIEFNEEKIQNNLGYFNLGSSNIGDVMPTIITLSDTKCYQIIKVKKGESILLKTYTTSGVAGYVRPYCLTNSENVVIDIAEAKTTYDYSNGKIIDISEDGKLYVACNIDFVSNFSFIRQQKNSISNDIENINDSIARLEEVLDKRNIYTKDDAVASDSYYNLLNVNIGDTYNGLLGSTFGSIYYTIKLQVKKGESILLKTYTTSGVAGYVRPYCLTNSENVVIDIAEAKTTSDYLEGKKLSIENDGSLYVTCKNGYQDSFSIEVVVSEGEISKKINELEKTISEYNELSSYTKIFGVYLPNNKVILNGASFSQYNGYFELAMKKLGINGTNESVAGTNIFKLANKLYSNPVYYKDFDVLIIAHVHNFDVFNLPKALETYTPNQYENDSIIGEYITTQLHVSGAGNFGNNTYTDDELYAIGYDYCIKKYIELCYNFKDQEGYDSLIGKPVQIILYTHWHDARVIYNNSIRKLANKWGFILIKEDENIGFSKKRVHPIANKQQSILYCNGTPWGSKTEVIDGVTYGFHPSGIASGEWTNFIQLDASEMIYMLPYIQIKRAYILMEVFNNKL